MTTPEKLHALRFHAIQAEAAIGAADFAQRLTPDLDSEYLGRARDSRVLRALLRAYWRVARATLR